MPDQEGIDKGNASYLDMFAESLIESLGREGAIRTCQEFGWGGVLRVVLGKEQGGD